MPASSTRIDTRRLFYHYLQKQLLEEDVWLFQMLVARLVVALGIWLDPSVYHRLPILVPFALRHPHSRGNKKLGLPDAWGTPDEQGYFWDDNSLVKGLPHSLRVQSPTNSMYHGRQIGTGFVAAHVWQHLTNGERGARHPLTYSFVPNLVWLPSEVAGLTDRPGSFVQQYVQSLSRKIYAHEEVAPGLKPVVKRAWKLLAADGSIPEQGLPDISQLNFFTPTEKWFTTRIKTIRQVAEGLSDAKVEDQIVSKRYTEGLKGLDTEVTSELRKHLEKILDASSKNQ